MENKGFRIDEWEGSTIYYLKQLEIAAREGRKQCYKFGNCRFDCESVSNDLWTVHAYDTDGNNNKFYDMSTIHVAGMMHVLFNSWGSGTINEQ